MTPDFNLKFNNKPFLTEYKKHLQSLRITDEAGTQCDSVELVFVECSRQQLTLPTLGTSIEISIGYTETGQISMGNFILNEITQEGPPYIITLKAHAADFKEALTAPRSQSFPTQTIGELVAHIAHKNGLITAISPEYEAITLPHLDQQAESDMHLLTRLAKSLGAITKPAGGHLLFVTKGKAHSVTGKPLGIITFTSSDIEHYRVSSSSRQKLGSVIACWYDVTKAQECKEQVGEGNPCHVLRGHYPNREAAQCAAHAYLKSHRNATELLTIELMGTPEIMVESYISLQGFSSNIPKEWVVSRVEHVIDENGFKTALEALSTIKYLQK